MSVNYLQINAGNGAVKSGFSVNIYSLSVDDFLNKRIILDFTPSDPSSIVIMPAGGTVQKYGVDYTIIGNMLLWSGLGLDGVLDTTDTLFLYY